MNSFFLDFEDVSTNQTTDFSQLMGRLTSPLYHLSKSQDLLPVQLPQELPFIMGKEEKKRVKLEWKRLVSLPEPVGPIICNNLDLDLHRSMAIEMSKQLLEINSKGNK